MYQYCHKLNKNNNNLQPPQCCTKIFARNPKFKINSSKCKFVYLSAENISVLVSNQGSLVTSITMKYGRTGIHNIVMNKNQKYFQTIFGIIKSRKNFRSFDI
jgi:hypothetical protein